MCVTWRLWTPADGERYRWELPSSLDTSDQSASTRWRQEDMEKKMLPSYRKHTNAQRDFTSSGLMLNEKTFLKWLEKKACSQSQRCNGTSQKVSFFNSGSRRKAVSTGQTIISELHRPLQMWLQAKVTQLERPSLSIQAYQVIPCLTTVLKKNTKNIQAS